jgi:RNA polymerase sigma factor (sigma-70 family)
MHIIHPSDLNSPATFACAQVGCSPCLDVLIRQHEGLIHTIIQRQHRGGVAYDDLVQEGRIGLWRAVLGFDPRRGYAFSTYAWKAIERRIWQAVGKPLSVESGRRWHEQTNPKEGLPQKNHPIRCSLLKLPW